MDAMAMATATATALRRLWPAVRQMITCARLRATMNSTADARRHHQANTTRADRRKADMDRVLLRGRTTSHLPVRMGKDRLRRDTGAVVLHLQGQVDILVVVDTGRDHTDSLLDPTDNLRLLAGVVDTDLSIDELRPS